MDIHTFSRLFDISSKATLILFNYVIYYASIFIIFIIWFLSIIIMQKLFTVKINKVYKIISMFVLCIAILTLPICIIYDLKKNSIYYFHQVFYDSGVWATRWFGIPLQKNPLDMWVYQEIIYEIKPDIIIECGTYRGGSALFFANLCDLLGNGKVITIDIDDFVKEDRKHNRIIYLHGSSTSDQIVAKVKSLITKNDKVLVCLDSDHHKQHVLNELTIYSQLVSKGSYIVVEDTNINGNPVYPTYGDGPMEAVKEFIKINSNFVADRSREKFLISFYPNGYLKKIK